MIHKGHLFVAAAPICFIATAAQGQVAPEATPPSSITSEEARPASAPLSTADATNSRPTGAGELEDIVVTAQRRDQNLQKVPIAVSVASAARLQSAGITDIQSLKRAYPVEADTHQM